MQTLSIVATPIGNMEDITLRALRTLGEADVIVCEDTRVTKKLLDRHNISKPTVSYHARSSSDKTEGIIKMLEEGKKVALVTDAGTPGISDPGAELVSVVRNRLPQIKIEAIPGPSALTAALSVAGVPCSDFIFLGFMPHKKGRETLFKEIDLSERTVVFYESPHRIQKSLESLCALEGKRVTVCREISKIFEEVIGGTPAFVKEYFDSNADKVRGEFVVIVSEDKKRHPFQDSVNDLAQ